MSEPSLTKVCHGVVQQHWCLFPDLIVSRSLSAAQDCVNLLHTKYDASWISILYDFVEGIAAAQARKPAHIASIYLEGDGEGGEALGKEPDDGVAEKDLVSLHSTSVSLALICANLLYFGRSHAAPEH